MISDQNKHSFYEVVLSHSTTTYLNPDGETFDELLDEFISKVNPVEKDFYVFFDTIKNQITYLFKVEPRRRTSYIKKIVDELSSFFFFDYALQPLTKDQKVLLLNNLKKDSDIRLIRGSSVIEYTGEDISIFRDKENYYPWQKDLYNKIFQEDDSLKPIEYRKIISIVDPKGKCGKSTFVKYLCYKREDFVKLSYGTSMQLRSAILNIGPKKCYLIDLPRTSGTFDKREDILSVIEDLKNGHMTSPMYGKYSNILMDPPLVIVFSNIFFPYDSLSEDRWDSYMIVEKSGLPTLLDVGKTEYNRLFKKQEDEFARKKYLDWLAMIEKQKSWRENYLQKNPQSKLKNLSFKEKDSFKKDLLDMEFQDVLED